jgi:allantoin racemase
LGNAVKRIKVIVPIAMDEAGVANRAQQFPADFVRPGLPPDSPPSSTITRAA